MLGFRKARRHGGQAVQGRRYVTVLIIPPAVLQGCGSRSSLKVGKETAPERRTDAAENKLTGC